MTLPDIKGYTYGEASTSPVSMKDVDALKATVLFGPEDELYLRMASHVLRDQTDAVLDLWYGFVGSHPHLVHAFISALPGKQAAYPNVRQSANITCVGILAHESALQGGKRFDLPAFTLSEDQL